MPPAGAGGITTVGVRDLRCRRTSARFDDRSNGWVDESQSLSGASTRNRRTRQHEVRQGVDPAEQSRQLFPQSGDLGHPVALVNPHLPSPHSTPRRRYWNRPGAPVNAPPRLLFISIQ